MPLNYRKNDVNYTIEYYSDINDLNYPGLSTNKINIRVNNTTNYIGLVNSSHEQASDLSVRVNNTNLRLAKKSSSPPSGLSYNNGQTATPLTSSSVSYSPTLTVGTNITYSVSPSLPSGLSLNTSTGVISGTTPSSSSDTTYTITATNNSGSTTASFRINTLYFSGSVYLVYIGWSDDPVSYSIAYDSVGLYGVGSVGSISPNNTMNIGGTNCTIGSLGKLYGDSRQSVFWSPLSWSLYLLHSSSVSLPSTLNLTIGSLNAIFIKENSSSFYLGGFFTNYRYEENTGTPFPHPSPSAGYFPVNQWITLIVK